MGSCVGCRHWNNHQPYPRGWGACSRMEGWGVAPSSPGSLAFAVPGEGDYAEVVTSPDFGCVMFEDAPPPRLPSAVLRFEGSLDVTVTRKGDADR